jgi:hypothetical protein
MYDQIGTYSFSAQHAPEQQSPIQGNYRFKACDNFILRTKLRARIRNGDNNISEEPTDQKRSMPTK